MDWHQVSDHHAKKPDEALHNKRQNDHDRAEDAVGGHHWMIPISREIFWISAMLSATKPSKSAPIRV